MFSLYVKLVGRIKKHKQKQPPAQKTKKEKYSKEALGKVKKGNQFLN